MSVVGLSVAVVAVGSLAVTAAQVHGIVSDPGRAIPRQLAAAGYGTFLGCAVMAALVVARVNGFTGGAP